MVFPSGDGVVHVRRAAEAGAGVATCAMLLVVSRYRCPPEGTELVQNRCCHADWLLASSLTLVGSPRTGHAGAVSDPRSHTPSVEASTVDVRLPLDTSPVAR